MHLVSKVNMETFIDLWLGGSRSFDSIKDDFQKVLWATTSAVIPQPI
jgi:hypothetical protein